MYTFIELSQRYNIKPEVKQIINGLDQAILQNLPYLQDYFRQFWSTSHNCGKTGCPEVDGGCKPHRKLCGGKLNGITFYEEAGINVVTGCKNIPIPGKNYCKNVRNKNLLLFLLMSCLKTLKLN